MSKYLAVIGQYLDGQRIKHIRSIRIQTLLISSNVETHDSLILVLDTESENIFTELIQTWHIS